MIFNVLFGVYMKKECGAKNALVKVEVNDRFLNNNNNNNEDILYFFLVVTFHHANLLIPTHNGFFTTVVFFDNVSSQRYKLLHTHTRVPSSVQYD